MHNLAEQLPMSRTQSISELETEIRDFINRPRRQHELLADPASWNTLCSALDVIDDTELALEAYAKWERRSKDGEKYLLVYGALQVMEVQQDAVKYICETLGLPYSRPKELMLSGSFGTTPSAMPCTASKTRCQSRASSSGST
jgi:hypothetical protein